MADLEAMNIFNIGVTDVDLYDETKESVLYKPTADAGNDGIYRSLIRFLPNPVNPKRSILRKFVYWLEDMDGNGSYYDSPSTVGSPCPVQDLFFTLRKSESAIDKKNSEKLKRREIFYSLIQIVKDPQKPNLEGKVKIFKYGWKLKQKLDEEMKPKFDEPTQIFDLFEGKNFELTITKQGGFNNYDSSKFSGKITPIVIDEVVMQKTKEDMDNILGYLKGCPKLEDFDYKPWDDEIRSKVNEILSVYRVSTKSYDQVTSNESSSDIDEISSFEKDLSAVTEMSDSTEPTKPKDPAAPTEEGEKENLNTFLDGLGLE